VPGGSTTLDAAAISSQLGEPYERFDAASRQRHVRLLARITGPAAIAVHVEYDPAPDAAQSASPDAAGAGAGRRATVTVSSADTPGVLSLIAGLFAAHRINVRSADIFTLEVGGEPGSESPEATAPPRAAGRPALCARAARVRRWPGAVAPAPRWRRRR
jgi:hypothetical protein